VTGPSFDEYVRGRGTALVRFAQLLTADWGLAEDLVQEALVSAHPKWDRITKMDHPDAYVRQTIVRKFLSWRRRLSSRERPSGFLADRPAPAVPDPSGRVLDRDTAWRLLATLPRRQRAVLVLRYYEDLPDDEIGRVLGCAPSTVRVHAARGMAALRPHVGGLSRAGGLP
jgi:RNA polymerase sigma-70 factor (sigma-E family)